MWNGISALTIVAYKDLSEDHLYSLYIYHGSYYFQLYNPVSHRSGPDTCDTQRSCCRPFAPLGVSRYFQQDNPTYRLWDTRLVLWIRVWLKTSLFSTSTPDIIRFNPKWAGIISFIKFLSVPLDALATRRASMCIFSMEVPVV